MELGYTVGWRVSKGVHDLMIHDVSLGTTELLILLITYIVTYIIISEIRSRILVSFVF